MISLTVLGHNGMLGNAVLKYFSEYPDIYNVATVTERWGEQEFKDKLLSMNANFIINCIGATPQKYSDQPEKYRELNIDLPIFLETIGAKIIHPSTDCEFSGNLPAGETYKKNDIRDASDAYGKSKAYISEKIETEFKNTKIMRVSIIGHELGEKKVSLLEWILSSKGPVKGYTDHFWNGITTLEWSRRCENLLENWGVMPVLNQYGTKKNLSKYELVKLIAKIYTHNIVIEPYQTGQNVNKCLESDTEIEPMEQQLAELKQFYGKPKS